MVSILIVSEGIHELSCENSDGALPILVRRLLGNALTISVQTRQIHELKGHVHPGRGDRLGRKFIGIVRLAEREGFDAVVILIDQDGDSTRFKSATFAQETTVTSFPRAIGIAVKTFDAWFLADHQSLSKVLKTDVDMQPDPESIGNPKAVCQLLNENAVGDLRLRDLYTNVAMIADLQTLRQRCLSGFSVFAARIEALQHLFS